MYEYESADASFDLLLRRFLRGEDTAFQVLRYHVGIGNDSEREEAVSEATVKLRIGEETRHMVAEEMVRFPPWIMPYAKHWFRIFQVLQKFDWSTSKLGYWKAIWVPMQ